MRLCAVDGQDVAGMVYDQVKVLLGKPSRPLQLTWWDPHSSSSSSPASLVLDQQVRQLLSRGVGGYLQIRTELESSLGRELSEAEKARITVLSEQHHHPPSSPSPSPPTAETGLAPDAPPMPITPSSADALPMTPPHRCLCVSVPASEVVDAGGTTTFTIYPLLIMRHAATASTPQTLGTTPHPPVQRRYTDFLKLVCEYKNALVCSSMH
jgi:hypothetical protein